VTSNTFASDAAATRAIALIMAKTPDIRATLHRQFPELTPRQLDAALDIARASKPEAFGLKRKPVARADVFDAADPPATLARLARAVGCPDREAPVAWLKERGMIERVGAGYRFKTTKAATSS
jgi:hypothetical protein